MPIERPRYLASRRVHPKARVETAQLPDGRIIEPLLLEFNDWAGILALTPAQEVVLVRLYRRGVDDIIWEIPGGMIDPGETPLEAARRELLEETGYGGGQFIALPVISPNPDNHTNRYHPFLALNVVYQGPQSTEDVNRMEVHRVPLPEVIRMAQRGEFLQAMQVSTLFFALSYWGRISA
ncbi:MAG: NUDIX hydrolase [Anaerolineales bacterium]|nr:NUDIX hydrolase [Anaerolineales bacterium]MDW8277898.1 NUDIX hydrolase [Anaerolineales bacterium]